MRTCLLAGMLALFPATTVAVPFTFDFVGAENTGTSTELSIAFEAAGSPRLSFNTCCGYPEQLFYAEKTGDIWTIEVVDATNGAGRYSSLALDSFGEPHISYHGSSDLRYATRSGGAWTTETVDSYGFTGYYTSIAIDSQNTPHISYYARSLDANGQDIIGNLVYATKSAGQWITQNVDVVGDVGLYTSLELDASESPCISYYAKTFGRLKFARKEGETWTKEVIEPVGANGGYTSLAIDSDGNCHISYKAESGWFDGNFKYAMKSDGLWATEVVDTTSLYTSIVVDAQNRPWISYWEAISGDLKLATKQMGVWTTQTVDAHGAESAILLDSQDLPWIAYNKPGFPSDLKLAIPNTDAVGVEPFAASDAFVSEPYPNPSRGSVSLAIRVPNTDSVRLTLFDIGGRLISRISAQELQGGSRVLTWNPQEVESGIYFLRLESSSGIEETRQVTLIR